MIKHSLKCPFIIGRFEQHNELKDKILTAINNQKEFDHLYEEHDAVDITRCDWHTSRFDPTREWVQILMDPLANHLQKVTEKLGYVEFKIQELWFQQYAQTSTHGWHVHGSNWTNVYYLELPEDCPRTQYYIPFDQTTLEEFGVREGDILTFPSFVVHRAPINNSSNRKTIISWNMDTELKPGLYNE
jgi:uncharacterized RmlC-like cupin family protein